MKWKTSSASAEAQRHGKGQRLFSRLILLVLLLCLTAATVFAAEEWDGSSDTSGGGGIAVTGGFSLKYADINDLYGYRFTVLDSSGNKPDGTRSVDIVFKGDDPGYNIRRTKGADKRSHVELYKEYAKYEAVALISKTDGYYAPNFTASTDMETAGNNGLFFYSNYFSSDQATFQDPATIGTWLLSEDRAEVIASDFCDYEAFTGLDSCYIIVEPLYIAELNGTPYEMTLAEFAVYQAAFYGCWDYSGLPDWSAQGEYSALMRHLNALYSLHLYSTEEYEALSTSPIESGHIMDLTSYGVAGNHIIIEPSSRIWTNSAENILKYQMGMGIYTKIPQGVTTSDVTIRVWVQDIGGTANSYDEDNYTMDDSYDAGTISAGVYDEHDFVDDHGPGSITGFSSYPVYIEVNGSQELNR